MEHIQDTCFVILDVETTGLSTRNGDKIIEVAGLKLQGLNIVDRFESLINPLRPLSYEAFLVNWITPEMVEGAPAAAEILPQFYAFLQDSCLVGHNIKFDLSFLSYEFSSLGLDLDKKIPALDTCKMARGLMPELGRYALKAVAYALGVVEPQRHRAMADVEMTYEVFRSLMDMAERRDIYALPILLRLFGRPGSCPATERQGFVEMIREAMNTSRSLELIYSGRCGRDITFRTVTPKQIVGNGPRAFLVGHCHLRQEERMFRLDRIVWLAKNREADS